MKLVTDLTALAHNIKVIRGRLPSSSSFILMVKADAYNHGVKSVAPFAEPLVDGFGVATVAEGAELRILGIEKPILVSAASVSEAHLISRYGLQAMVGSLELLKVLANRGEPLSIDLKIDTGFNRYGIKPDRLDEAIEIISSSALKLRAVCTHFMCPGSAVHQNAVFLACSSKVENRFGKVKRHAASSYFAETGAYCYDETRVGLLAYGYGLELPVKPVMSVKAEVEFVKTVKKGESVGYNALFVAERPTEIALIRAGYYDGVRRDMRGTGILIDGKRVPIVGAVSMDSFTADVTGLGVSEGAEAVFVGEGQSAEVLAKALGTNVYEVLTQFGGRRAERVFLRD